MTFTFSVISTTGQRISISVLGPDNTVGDIKAKLEETEGIPQKMIMFLHGGRKLEDNATLEECNIHAGVTINMVLALRAGC
ncbi:ubiquitin-like protein [Leptomonas pyrrhocoris]|uniref:Ubiquitin-like protein n=1 Tax=Leptomonas pyrrhocoris TaxID=157538 RepID=A0A0N0VFW3_LEPPY|nr:ubiquitin-like protein [Leptomonas pyrrhocoris]XP_015660694.1 ubiquitin-like protein [Leptomonas pyrrhocoris]KPA82254.1 ubiquitin-like protein [Leptomonas pyrrhocoris]KPA82255.1 ubiquitin-like protein [Leptomonas pyrrhocoris]|eukprot:XP_015660693.1 ubiquitin-like protein [Leptomonas pyrrhocoris]